MFRLKVSKAFTLTGRHFFITWTIILSIGMCIAIIINMKQHKQIDKDLIKMQTDLVALQSQIMLAQQKDIGKRLVELEKEVFGTSTPEPTKVIIHTGPAQWQQNRDKELRKRIEALEAWRMKMNEAMEVILRE